ncbi:hypothetical protein ACHAXT_001291 [Thalassiosira profunda]
MDHPTAAAAGGRAAVRKSKRLHGRDGGEGATGAAEASAKRGRRTLPAREAKAKRAANPTTTPPPASRRGAAKRPASSKKSAPKPIKSPEGPSGSGAPRPPRVLIARHRLGGRLRTVDLMLDTEWSDETKHAKSDLCRVQRWSPVDVGGQFIHGTGHRKRKASDAQRKKSRAHPPRIPNRRAGSRNAGTPSFRVHLSKTTTPIAPTARRAPTAAARTASGSTPVYTLARTKMRLPLHAADGSRTCLVDHNGRPIPEKVDEEVAEEFNAVLDLATKCCERGRYVWMEGGDEAASSSGCGAQRKMESPTRRSRNKGVATGNAARSPNYVSDDTAPAHAVGAAIDPGTDFGTIFAECKRYHDSLKRDSPKSPTEEEDEVRAHLFEWHVAQLEMSSGAPMRDLGQRWNDDEPFGYGGDHSYVEGGTRDLVEALAEGFDCRGLGDRSLHLGGAASGGAGGGLRRSGDFASTFGGRQSTAASDAEAARGATMHRGVIQCGIEVTGVKVVERDEAQFLRRQKGPARAGPPSRRRSTRENKGMKVPSFAEARSSSRAEGGDGKATGNSRATSGEAGFAAGSSYANDHNSIVQVTTKCGLTLEADAVVVTTPLAILAIPPGAPGHISFSPALPTEKRNAINRLGVGNYNKCCMSFATAFWNNLPRHLSARGMWHDEATQRFDFIGHASAAHGKDILFFSLRNAPILVAIYGGSEYSTQIEGMHDEDVVGECMAILKKVCRHAIAARGDALKTRRHVDLDVPDWPIDFFVSRWGSDPHSRGAFCYVPPGVRGIDELRAMSAPVCDYRPEWAEGSDDKPKRPLIMFAGEATTPFHPSTIHGAFETGIREAYRLDLALEPTLNQGLSFEESTAIAGSKWQRRSMPKAGNWWFDHDASILRGVESFGASAATMRKIKSKVLAPSGDIHSPKEMVDRYKALMRMLSPPDDAEQTNSLEKDWRLPGRNRGTWLAPGQAKRKRGSTSTSGTEKKH